LYYAIKLGNLEFVEKLIEKGALVHYNDASPLHLAAGFSHQKMVDYFLSKGAQIEVTDRYGHTPLYYAASYGNEEVIYHLLDKGANCRFNYYNDIQDEGVKTTVLHIAIQEHNIWGIKPSIDHFLKNNISLNELDSYGFSPLYRAVEHHWMDIVKELCNKGATIGLGPFQKHPLRAAIVENEYSIERCELHDIYTWLLDKMDTQYKESGEKERYLELLTELLHKLTTGYPSFVESKHFFVKELLQRHSLPISRKSYSYFAKKTLQELQEYQHLDTILTTPTFFFECMKAKNKALVEQFSSPFFVFLLKDEEGNTAAHYVTDCSMAELVIQHKVDFTVKNNKGQTPLHTYFGDYDVSGGVLKFAYELPKIVKKKVVTRVLRRNPPPLPELDSDDEDEVVEPIPVPKKRTSPPVKVGFARLVELFLQQGVDINAKDNLGVTALQLAVHKHYREETILSALLEQGADINDAGSYKAPLQIACESTYKDKSLIAFLLDHGADPAKLTGEHGFVHYIFKNAYFDLLDKVKDVALNEQDSNGYTPLYYLLTNFQSTAYQHIPMLVSKGLDLNVPYDKRIGMRFVLTYAVMERNITLVKTLVQHGATIDTKDYEGQTALHFACKHIYMRNMPAIRDYLLEKGARTDILDDEGHTALFYENPPNPQEEE
jgi:ankyrin repeat protein